MQRVSLLGEEILESGTGILACGKAGPPKARPCLAVSWQGGEEVKGGGIRKRRIRLAAGGAAAWSPGPIG